MGKGKNNLTPKIFALIIATILWSYVMGVKNPDWPREYKSIDVEFVGLEDLDRKNLIVMDPQEAKINVSVTGRRTDMENFTAGNNIVARLDLSGYSEGQVRVPVLVSLKDSASTVRITKYEPTDVLVNIDRIVTESKTVNIRVEGNIPDDYTIGDIVSKPATVLLRGPRTWVNEVSEAFTVVSLGDRLTSANITLPIQLQNQLGEDVVGLEKIPSVVDISIPIFRKATLPIEVVLENELPDNYVITKMEVLPGSIAVKGGNSVGDLTSIKTKPIDINLLLENPNLEVELDLLENIELIDPNERVIINAVIETIDSQEFDFEFSEIDVRNLNENLLIEHENDTINIVVSATESILENISKNDLKPYINVRNFLEGEYEVDINIEEIEGITIESIDPEKVTISLINR